MALDSESVGRQVPLRCPLISNPPPVCNWSKYDDNNTRQEVLIGNNIGFLDLHGNCFIAFFPLKEIHSGLYECTASNAIGSTTYKFPERISIESKYVLLTHYHYKLLSDKENHYTYNSLCACSSLSITMKWHVCVMKTGF